MNTNIVLGKMRCITTGKKRLRDRYYDWKKKDTVICLAGARSLLRPEKKIQSSVWRVRDRYYDRKKKIQSSVWRVYLVYNTVVRLCQFFVVAFWCYVCT